MVRGTGTPSDWLSPSEKRGLRWILSMIGVFICGILAKFGWDLMKDGMKDDEK